jgi:hypothetical protein
MERDMVGDEKATGRPGAHVDGQVQLMTLEARPTADGDQPIAMLIDPATAIRAHLIGRWHIQQGIPIWPLDEDALAVGAE